MEAMKTQAVSKRGRKKIATNTKILEDVFGNNEVSKFSRPTKCPLKIFFL
jgi:hypothetical protein